MGLAQRRGWHRNSVISNTAVAGDAGFLHLRRLNSSHSLKRSELGMLVFNRLGGGNFQNMHFCSELKKKLVSFDAVGRFVRIGVLARTRVKLSSIPARPIIIRKHEVTQ